MGGLHGVGGSPGLRSGADPGDGSGDDEAGPTATMGRYGNIRYRPNGKGHASDIPQPMFVILTLARSVSVNDVPGESGGRGESSSRAMLRRILTGGE